MSTFDIRPDAPGTLRTESLNITITFNKTGPTTGRVSWNIPTPAAGCTAENQAYCGMLVTLDTSPATSSKTPKDGTVYSSDSTADVDTHAGDRLGTSLVVGGFYNDRTTTFFDVEGLAPNEAYYVSGYPMDCQHRYFSGGVHAYSLDFKTERTQIHDSTHGKIVVELNYTSQPSGVQLTDTTNLVAGVDYEFDIQLGVLPAPRAPLDATECKPITPTYTIKVEGEKASTYQELIDEINVQLALLSNPFRSPFPPYANGFYWNPTTQVLSQWTGFIHNILPVIISGTQPNLLVIGDWWFNPTTEVLSQWDGAAWDAVTYISHTTDPRSPACDDVWYDGIEARIWNGTVWCGLTTISQITDPSLAVEPPCGSYWYDTVNEVLMAWDATIGIWKSAEAIQYHVDPNALPVSTYWFNDVTNTLRTLDTPDPGWNAITTVSIVENAPTTPAPGRYWYKPSTMELFQRNLANTAWVQLDVIVFGSDPEVRGYCDLWWNTDTDELNVWDAVNSVWAVVASFFQQAIDPSNPPVMDNSTSWFNPSTNVLYTWEDNCFKPTEYIQLATDPTTIGAGVVWHDTDDNKWYQYSGVAWVEFTPTTSINDPSTLPANTYWFNTTSSTLQVWSGVAWIQLMYSTQPLTPILNTEWFNDTDKVLMKWNGTAWVLATPKATLEHDCANNFLFTDTVSGSLSYVRIEDRTLFKSLEIPFDIHLSKPGSDGVSDEPSYVQSGVGTDGSMDERLKLMNEIRYELGYPVINVELTNEQLDFCITKALEVIRARTAIAYKHGFFFMRIGAETQRYLLTNKTQEMDKIVTVLGIYRLTSSFLSSAHGAGVYGQIVLQHLYNMGTFDLLSYHLMSEYTELMEILFAGRITFSWNEQKRELWIHHRFPFNERMVLIEATVERTEQDIIVDRWCRTWMRQYATANAKMMLAEIRGKYSTLPGASGSVTLNASDLRQSAQLDLESCMRDIDDYVADKPDDFGMGTQFVLG